MSVMQEPKNMCNVAGISIMGVGVFDRGSAVVQTPMRVLLIISAEYLVEFMTRLATITWAMLYS
ncbi:MAG: hypothetical protein QM401_11685 [Bacillota bacterium]|nr:hypothetical protein [Bacillota bacterium]